jgi:gamma-glutamyl phosphate reductase
LPIPTLQKRCWSIPNVNGWGVCNAAESLVIHGAAVLLLPRLEKALRRTDSGVNNRVCNRKIASLPLFSSYSRSFDPCKQFLGVY